MFATHAVLDARLSYTMLPSPSATVTFSPSPTASTSLTASATRTETLSPTVTPTISVTPSPSVSLSALPLGPEQVKFTDYWTILDVGTAAPAGWTSLQFNDSAWRVGRAVFGEWVCAEDCRMLLPVCPFTSYAFIWWWRGWCWCNVPFAVGYGYNDIVTQVNYGGNAMNCWITTYFRKVFTYSRPDNQQYVCAMTGNARPPTLLPSLSPPQFPPA